MAQINLTITIPDQHVNRVLAGLRGHFGPVEDPPGSNTFRDLTQAEIRTKLEQLTRETIRNIVTNREAAAAVANVKTSYDEIGVS